MVCPPLLAVVEKSSNPKVKELELAEDTSILFLNAESELLNALLVGIDEPVKIYAFTTLLTVPIYKETSILVILPPIGAKEANCLSGGLEA